MITGGSDGIGYAIADRLADDGTELVLVARDAERLQQAADRLRRPGGGPVHVIASDLGQPGAVDGIVEQIHRLTDRVDVLVNNAGVARFVPLGDTTDDDVDTMMHLNVKVPLALTRGLLDDLRRAAGSVVNVTSYWATKMVAGRPSAAYSATRSAISGMTMALANALGPQGIRVNAIAPGAVLTSTYQHSYLDPMTGEQRQRHDEHVRAAYPLRRIGAPRDVAAAAGFLCSPDAAWITGTVLAVDGGLSIR